MTPEQSEDVDRLACAISESKRLRAQSAVFLDTCRQPGKPGQAVIDLKELSRLWADHPQHLPLVSRK